MIRRAPTKVCKLATRTVKMRLFGGEDNLCAHTFGYRIADGVMSPGFAKSEIITSVPADMVFTKYLPSVGYTILINERGHLYRWNLGEFKAPLYFRVFSPGFMPFVAVYGKETAGYAVFSGDKLCNIEVETQDMYSSGFVLSNGVYHYGRVFGVDNGDKRLIHWSGFDHTNWEVAPDGGGNLRVPDEGGDILNLVSIGSKIMIVRERGINVLSAMGDERHFTLSGLLRSPEILPNTAAVNLGKLYVCRKDGIYLLDDGAFKRVGPPKTCPVNDFTEVFVADNGRMYFTVTNDDVSELLEYDVHSGSFTLCAQKCHTPWETEDGLYCLRGTDIIKLSEDGVDNLREWTSEQITLGTPRGKLLKKVCVEGEGDLSVYVDCDGHSRRVGGFGEFYVGERGASFTFSVKGQGKLSQLTAEWEVPK